MLALFLTSEKQTDKDKMVASMAMFSQLSNLGFDQTVKNCCYYIS